MSCYINKMPYCAFIEAHCAITIFCHVIIVTVVPSQDPIVPWQYSLEWSLHNIVPLMCPVAPSMAYAITMLCSISTIPHYVITIFYCVRIMAYLGTTRLYYTITMFLTVPYSIQLCYGALLCHHNGFLCSNNCVPSIFFCHSNFPLCHQKAPLAITMLYWASSTLLWHHRAQFCLHGVLIMYAVSAL